MNKLMLIFALLVPGCSTGVVTLERPIPANMLIECEWSLPTAMDGKAATILRTSVARTAMYRECATTHNALVKYLADHK